jgi:hypothetical protein
MIKRKILNYDLIIPEMDSKTTKFSCARDYIVWTERTALNKYEGKHIQSRKSIISDYFPLVIVDIITIYSISYCEVCMLIGIKKDICYECTIINSIPINPSCIINNDNCYVGSLRSILIYDSNHNSFIAMLCDKCVESMHVNDNMLKCGDHYPEAMGLPCNAKFIVLHKSFKFKIICMNCMPNDVHLMMGVFYSFNTSIYDKFIKLTYD